MKRENLDKKYNTRNGIIIGVASSALILTGFLGSYAFFQATGTSTNEQVSVTAGTMELIFSDGNNGFEKALDFGESAEKTFTIKNNGSLDAVAKINWKNLVNSYLEESLTYSLSYTTEEDSTPKPVITDKNVPRSTEPSTVELANGLAIPSGKTYTYTLTITLNDLESTDQTADLNARLSTEFSIEEGSSTIDNPIEEPGENSIKETGKATEVLLSRMNAANITDYNSEEANKGEMFTFEHESTEQTPELTDYRYIGDTPNNYITFNDETWRIIGVFSVQSEEDGAYEQRVKIIKNELMDPIAWDTNGGYDWISSSLSDTLNRYYYMASSSFSTTGLKDTARSQIASAKWYLGSDCNDRDPTSLYALERGISTVAKVGLIYASDFYYTYVSDKSWVKENFLYEWTMGPQTILCNQDEYVCGTDTTTSIKYRPTVYLRPDAEIISGDGTQDNMYTLKAIEN